MTTLYRILDTDIVCIPSNALLIYGMAYTGRTYLLMNPLHVAIYSLVTNLFIAIAEKNIINDEGKMDPRKINIALLFAVGVFSPTIFVAAKNIFSPIQTITALGLLVLSNGLRFKLMENFKD